MSALVYKFGGTSVATRDALLRLQRFVASASEPVCLVVSAMAGTTDQLHLGAMSASTGKSIPLTDLLVAHLDLAASVIDEPSILSGIECMLQQDIEHLESVYKSLEVLGELTEKVVARVVSYGEKWMTRIVAGFLQADHEVHLADASEIIKVDDRFSELTVDLPETEALAKHHIVKYLEQGKIVVLAGFISSNRKGELVTLGRGGSDYSASLIAQAINAASLTLFKEVDGLMTADPRYVASARAIPELHYREAAELAYYGAKVLHPRTIIPLVEKKIPLFVRSSIDEHLPGTRIAEDVEAGAYPVKALTAIHQQAMVSVEGKGMVGVPGIASRIFGALASSGISVSFISQSSSESSICFVIPSDRAERAKDLLEESFRFELERGLIENIQIDKNRSILAIVGLGMRGTPGIASRAFSSLSKKKVNIHAIAQGSSELNISIVLSESNVEEALRALHREYHLEKIKSYHLRGPSENPIVIYGMGQIGQTLLIQMSNQTDYFQEKLGISTPVMALADSSGMIVNSEFFEAEDILAYCKLKSSGKKLSSSTLDSEIKLSKQKLWSQAGENAIMVDLTASDSYEFLIEAIENDFHIVLANKKPLAVEYDLYQRLFEKAKRKGLSIRYEATVGAGLPVLDTLEKLMGSGDEVFEIKGCLSGTLGYILSQLELGERFSEVVERAFQLGYTEPDPRDDLSGIDVARKALILARTLGYEVNMRDIELKALYPEHLSHNDPKFFLDSLKELDDEYYSLHQEAKSSNEVLRYVASLSKHSIRVGLEKVSISSPLGGLKGTDNQIVIRTRRYDNQPLVVTGPGAGADVTAAGVLNDIVAIASQTTLVRL